MLPALPVEGFSMKGADMRNDASDIGPVRAGGAGGPAPRNGTDMRGEARLPGNSASQPGADTSHTPVHTPTPRGPATGAGAGKGKPGGKNASRSSTKRAEPAKPADKTTAPAGRGSAGHGTDGAGPGTAVVDTAAALPVREGEDRWTAAELAEVRAALIEESAALEAEITAAASQIAEGDGADGAGDDQADTGAKTYAREHELALTYNARDLLNQAGRAVARIDAGTYGICESCAKPVGKARLQAFPRATLCVSCKQREERR
jgi:RNA polymerase-binding protein DksA